MHPFRHGDSCRAHTSSHIFFSILLPPSPFLPCLFLLSSSCSPPLPVPFSFILLRPFPSVLFPLPIFPLIFSFLFLPLFFLPFLLSSFSFSSFPLPPETPLLLPFSPPPCLPSPCVTSSPLHYSFRFLLSPSPFPFFPYPSILAPLLLPLSSSCPFPLLYCSVMFPPHPFLRFRHSPFSLFPPPVSTASSPSMYSSCVGGAV